MVGGWIPKKNLRPFVEMVAYVAGYKFDDYDWTAIQAGVQESNENAGRWYSYRFPGVRALSLEATLDPNGGIVTFQVDDDAGLSPEIEAQLDLLFLMCETYDMTDPNWKR